MKTPITRILLEVKKAIDKGKFPIIVLNSGQRIHNISEMKPTGNSSCVWLKSDNGMEECWVMLSSENIACAIFPPDYLDKKRA